MGYTQELEEALAALEAHDAKATISCLLSEIEQARDWVKEEDLSPSNQVLRSVRCFLAGTGDSLSCGREGADLASYTIYQTSSGSTRPQPIHCYQRACANLALAVSSERHKDKHLLAVCDALVECDRARRLFSQALNRRLLANLQIALRALSAEPEPSYLTESRSRRSLLAS